MIDISQELVEEKITEVIQEIAETLEMEISIDSDSCPGLMPGITSQVLITVMGRLEKKLNVIIPDDCYVFYDEKEQKQLNIKKSAEKFIKNSNYGK